MASRSAWKILLQKFLRYSFKKFEICSVVLLSFMTMNPPTLYMPRARDILLLYKKIHSPCYPWNQTIPHVKSNSPWTSAIQTRNLVFLRCATKKSPTVFDFESHSDSDSARTTLPIFPFTLLNDKNIRSDTFCPGFEYPVQICTYKWL